MKTSSARSGSMRFAASRLVSALSLAMAIGGLSTTVAFGDDHDRRQGQQQNGQNHGYQHVPNRQQQYHGNGHPNERYDRRRANYYDNQQYGYVYAPPPVTYVPETTPGISLFLPLEFR